MSKLLFRLAPTPSGFLHQGNAFNFLLNWGYARQLGANVLLRIDDLDAGRSRVEYLEDIFETLHWLGLDWDEGPKNVNDFQQNWTQELRLPNYQKQLEYLVEKGLVFACDCTRKSLRTSGFTGVYPNICVEKRLPLTSDLPWRVRVPKGTVISVQDAKLGRIDVDLYENLGSFVIKTREGIPAYQLASLCDDVLFGVTHVIRGQDLLHSTAAQLYLAECLGFERFYNIQFYHHALLTNNEGDKLSKSAGSLSVKYLREHDFKPSDLLHEFTKWFNIISLQKITNATDLIAYLPPLFQ